MVNGAWESSNGHTLGNQTDYFSTKLSWLFSYSFTETLRALGLRYMFNIVGSSVGKQLTIYRFQSNN